MKLQLKRSLKTLTDNITAQAPTVDQMEYGELAINYATTDATIFLKDSNNVIQKLQVSAVPDVPAGETLDDRYVRLSGATLTGNLTAPSFIGGVARTSIGAPTTGQDGELWWNTSNGRLYIYDGDNSSWVDASPDSFTLGAGYFDKNESDARYVAKAGSTMTGPLLLSGNPGGEALAATPKQYVDGQVTGLDTTLRTYIDAQIATRAATTYVNTQLALKADTTYVTSAISTSEATAATTYVSKSGDVISGDLTANAFIGDGSQLTGVGSETLISNTPPTPANYEVGTMWWNSDSSDTSLYILYQDPIGPNGDPGGKYWIEASPAPDSIGFNGSHTGDSTFNGNMAVTGIGTFADQVIASKFITTNYSQSNAYGGYLNGDNGSFTLKKVADAPTSSNFLDCIKGTNSVITFNSEGYATFAGYVESDLFNVSRSAVANKDNYSSKLSVSDTGKHFNAKDTGGTTLASINADGSATFAGDITTTGWDGSSALGYRLDSGGALLLNQPGSEASISVRQNGSETASIKGDGSATFNRYVQFGDSNNNYRAILAMSHDASGTIWSRNFYNGGAVFEGANTSGDSTSYIYENGSATFASYVTSNEGFYVSQTAGPSGDSIFKSWLGSDTYVDILDNGSATFKGETIVQGTGKYFLKRNDAGSTSCAIRDDNLRIYNNPVSYDDYKISLENDGSATFAGHVTANGLNIYTLAPLTNGGQLGYDDPTKSLRLYSNSSIGTNAKTQFHFNQSGTADITFNEGGSATFAGPVNAGSDASRLSAGWGFQVYGGGNSNGYAIYQSNIHTTPSAPYVVRCNVNGVGDTVDIRSDGTATFGDSTDYMKYTEIDGLYRVTGGVTQWNLAADGSATFTGTVNSSEYLTNLLTVDGQNSTGTTSITLKYQNTDKFTVNNSGTAFFAGPINGTTVGTSDIKFKENIETAPTQLADIQAFELKTFDWKDEAPLSDELKSKQKLGLIAQEVEAICPEMICELASQDGDSYKVINHDVLIMKLLGAVKELAAEVAALKAS